MEIGRKLGSWAPAQVPTQSNVWLTREHDDCNPMWPPMIGARPYPVTLATWYTRSSMEFKFDMLINLQSLPLYKLYKLKIFNLCIVLHTNSFNIRFYKLNIHLKKF